MDRLPGWPTERQFVTTVTFAMGFMMLIMGQADAALWNVELFKTLITVVIVTGCVNMVLAYHFAANKNSDDATANTGKAFEAITATANSSGGSVDPSVVREGDEIVLEKK